MIRLDHLSAKRGKFELSGLTFDLEPGTIVGYIGRNGSGKTTTLNVLTGQVPVSGGDYRIDGKRLWELSDAELQTLAYVNAETVNYRFATTIQRAHRAFRPLYESFDNEKFLSLCRRLELDFDKRISSFSLGQYEKFLFAAALSHGTKYLFVDEVTATVDPLSKSVLFDILREFAEEGGAVLITSHILSDLEQICDRLLMIENGSIFLESTVDEMREKYAVIDVTDEMLADIPEDAVLSRKTCPLSTSLLVLRERVNPTYLNNAPSLSAVVVRILEDRQTGRGTAV